MLSRLDAMLERVWFKKCRVTVTTPPSVVNFVLGLELPKVYPPSKFKFVTYACS